MSADRPGSILFFCTMNAVRSPMAAAIARKLVGTSCFVSSAGIVDGEQDGFVIAAMKEWDINLSRHVPHAFSMIDDAAFDLYVTLSGEAELFVQTLSKTLAFEHEHWQVSDPTLTEGKREARMEAYRQLRTELEEKISARFAGSVRP